MKTENGSDSMIKLKLYVDATSPPARALTIFCRATDIEAQEIKVNLIGHESRTPEFTKLNPMGLVPCIEDDGFRLFESHAILRYLATTRNVADHWYPKDPQKRALIDAALDWHHLGLRKHSVQLLHNGVYVKIPAFKDGYYPKPVHDRDALIKEAVNALQTRAFDQLQSVLLQRAGKFVQGADEVSIADLSLACEIKQLELLGCEECKKLLESRARIASWMSDVEAATQPHFGDVHLEFSGVCQYFDNLRAQGDF